MPRTTGYSKVQSQRGMGGAALKQNPASIGGSGNSSRKGPMHGGSITNLQMSKHIVKK